MSRSSFVRAALQTLWLQIVLLLILLPALVAGRLWAFNFPFSAKVNSNSNSNSEDVSEKATHSAKFGWIVGSSRLFGGGTSTSTTASTNSRATRAGGGSSSSGNPNSASEFQPYLTSDDVARFQAKRARAAKELDARSLDLTEHDAYANPNPSPNPRPRRGGVWPRLLDNLPELSFRCDPVVNFKIKQRLSYLGACVTVGVDYLSDLQQWRAMCMVEDTVLHGRFSLKGSELSWAKSFLVNLGLGEESSAKFKLRCGINLNTLRCYARLRFRAEPLSCIDVADGLSAAGKLPLPGGGLLPLLRLVPLRVEYRLRVNVPSLEARGRGRNGRFQDVISLSTGIEKVDVSLDELNICLEWDEHAPLWALGLSKPPRLSSVASGGGGGGLGGVGTSAAGIGSGGNGGSSSGGGVGGAGLGARRPTAMARPPEASGNAGGGGNPRSFGGGGVGGGGGGGAAPSTGSGTSSGVGAGSKPPPSAGPRSFGGGATPPSSSSSSSNSNKRASGVSRW